MSNSVIESETHNGVKSDSTKKVGEIKHEEHDHDHMHGVGVFFWMITLIGTKLGAGIIGMPHAVHDVGYTTSVWYELVYFFLAIISLYLLLEVRDLSDESSYSDIGYFWFGRPSISS